MVVFDALAVAQYSVGLSRSAAPASASTSRPVWYVLVAAAGLKTLLSLSMIFMFARCSRRSGSAYQPVPATDDGPAGGRDVQEARNSSASDDRTGGGADSSDNDTDNDTDDDDTDDDDDDNFDDFFKLKSGRDKDVMLRKLVDKEIIEAGSCWKWVRKFSIFLPWMWP